MDQISLDDFKKMTTRQQIQAVIAGQADASLMEEAIDGQKTAHVQEAKEGTDLLITLMKGIANQDDAAPRLLRLTGDGISCPVRQRRADETQEDYLRTLPAVTAHLDTLVQLTTVARIPFLEWVASVACDPETVELTSLYDNARTYSRTVTRYAESDANMQLSRNGQLAEGKYLLGLVENALQNASETEVTHYPTISVSSKLNSNGEQTTDSPF